MAENYTIQPKGKPSPPKGVKVQPPEDNHLSAQDIKDDQRSKYRRRSQLASQQGIDPDRVEEARVMRRVQGRNNRRTQ